MGYSPLGEIRDGRYQGNEAPLGITAQVPSLACAIPAQICIAKHLGYSQYVLVGADFSFPNNQQRFTSRTWKDGLWSESKAQTLDEYYEKNYLTDNQMIETELDGLMSSGMQIFYSNQAVIACRLVEKSIINASHKGLLRMLPHTPIEDVIRAGNKGVKGFTLPQRLKVYEEYLARQNIFFFYLGTGIMPHEFKDPLHEVPKLLMEVKKMLTAQGKGDQLDVDANMKRIKRLFESTMTDAT